MWEDAFSPLASTHLHSSSSEEQFLYFLPGSQHKQDVTGNFSSYSRTRLPPLEYICKMDKDVLLSQGMRPILELKTQMKANHHNMKGLMKVTVLYNNIIIIIIIRLCFMQEM